MRPLLAFVFSLAISLASSGPNNRTLKSSAEFLFAVLDVPYASDSQTCYNETVTSLPSARDLLSPSVLLQQRQEISLQPVVDRACARIALRHKLVAHIRQSNHQHARWLLSLYESAHPSIAHGNPPLDLYTATAWYSLKRFLDPQNPLYKSKEDFIRNTAERYPQLPTSDQRTIQLAPLTLSQLESRRLRLGTADGLRWIKALRSQTGF